MAQYNFRLFLKPTVIGQAIIDRLSPEGADRQALARRWIELGYALEQAGFRLDGSTVFQGARPLSLEAPVAVSVPSHGLQTAPAPSHEARVAEASMSADTSLPTSSPSTTAVPASGDANAGAANAPAAPVVMPVPAVVQTPPVTPTRTSLALNAVADNLRNLSA